MTPSPLRANLSRRCQSSSYFVWSAWTACLYGSTAGERQGGRNAVLRPDEALLFRCLNRRERRRGSAGPPGEREPRQRAGLGALARHRRERSAPFWARGARPRPPRPPPWALLQQRRQRRLGRMPLRAAACPRCWRARRGACWGSSSSTRGAPWSRAASRTPQLPGGSSLRARAAAAPARPPRRSRRACCSGRRLDL